jgi:hypothetical protein
MAPVSSLENFPPEIRNNPRPHDECIRAKADSEDPPVLPEHRFRYFSLGAELNVPLIADIDSTVRPGILALFRPMPHWALGLQADTDFGEQLTVRSRVQGSVWLNRYDIWRLNLAGLVGFRRLFDQVRPVPGGQAEVTGTQFNAGLELGLEWSFAHECSWGSYAGFSFSPATELHNQANSKIQAAAEHEFLLGMRLSLDLFPHD